MSEDEVLIRVLAFGLVVLGVVIGMGIGGELEFRRFTRIRRRLIKRYGPDVLDVMEGKEEIN